MQEAGPDVYSVQASAEGHSLLFPWPWMAWHSVVLALLGASAASSVDLPG